MPRTLTLRMVRARPGGGVDTAVERIDAPETEAAIAAAARLTEAFLAGKPGLGVLTDEAQNRVVWSLRSGMPKPRQPPHRAG